MFYIVELVIPASVSPFATLAAGFLFLPIGWIRVRRYRTGIGAGALAMGLLVVLSMRFVDWNSRKPFLLDLYRVQLGMTINELALIMRHHPNKPTPDYPDRIVKENDTLVFRPTYGGAYNADWGIVTIKDHQVAGVEYSAD